MNPKQIFNKLLGYIGTDLNMDATSGGGYQPTPRVLTQRDWRSDLVSYAG